MRFISVSPLFWTKSRFQTFEHFHHPFWCFSYWHRFAWATSWSSQSPGSNLTQMMISIRPRPRFSILRRRYGGGHGQPMGQQASLQPLKVGKSLTKSIDVKGSSVEILKLVTPSENGWSQFYSTKNTHTHINIYIYRYDMYICCFVLKINGESMRRNHLFHGCFFVCYVQPIASWLRRRSSILPWKPLRGSNGHPVWCRDFQST